VSARRSTSHALLTRTAGIQLRAEVISVKKWFDWKLAGGNCDQMPIYRGTIEWLNECKLICHPHAPRGYPEHASYDIKMFAVPSVEMGNNCFPKPSTLRTRVLCGSNAIFYSRLPM